MQAIVPSLEDTSRHLDVTRQLANELFTALGSTLMSCSNDPTLVYSGLFACFDLKLLKLSR